jgi:EAL domain-containing protein (putative c-di-GMP-specific phosphodiesterase class I)
VALAQALGLGTIAEGVETEAQRAFLAEIGCDTYQGFLFSRPVDADELEGLMAV